MADKFSKMNGLELTHYIYHASIRSHEWLAKKEKNKKTAVDHYKTVIKGGTLHLDDDRGDIQWKGIENWEFGDDDPNTGTPFRSRFKTQAMFDKFQKNEISTLLDKIESEVRKKTLYADINEIKNRIDKGKIIICQTEDELNKTAKKDDKKIKNRIVLAVIKK